VEIKHVVKFQKEDMVVVLTHLVSVAMMVHVFLKEVYVEITYLKV